MRLKVLAAVGALFTTWIVAQPVFACTAPDSVMSYAPPTKRTTAKLRKTEEGYAIERVPRFKVSLKDARRSPGKGAMPCGEYGSITVQIEWPDASLYRLDEVGFYFRIVDSVNAPDIFGDRPVVGKIRGNTMQLFFVFPDEDPAQRKPWDLTVEVFAVGSHMEIGPPTRFSLESRD